MAGIGSSPLPQQETHEDAYGIEDAVSSVLSFVKTAAKKTQEYYIIYY